MGCEATPNGGPAARIAAFVPRQRLQRYEIENTFNHETFVIKLLAKSVNTASHKGCSFLQFLPR